MMCFSSSKRIKTLAIAELPATLFNISEAVMFGLPIILNPILTIPFILSYVVLAILSSVLTLMNIIPVPILSTLWILPAPIKAFLATNGSIIAFIYVTLLWIIIAIIFYPFIKILEKNELDKEVLKC